MASTSPVANKESICCTYCQAELEGSENTDMVGCRDGLLMGAVVAVLRPFHMVWGLRFIPQPLWQEGVQHFLPVGKKDQDQRAVTTS